MSDSTMAQAKRDFQRGFLDGFELVNNGMGLGWSVWLNPRVTGSGGWLTDARTKQPRQFQTLDAAVRTVQVVGFSVSRLYLDGN